MSITTKDKKVFAAKKGFSLIELIVVMSVVGALSFIVLANGLSSRDSQKIASETETLAMGVASVQSIYASAGYSSVTSAELAGMASFPNSLKNTGKTGLENAWGGGLDITGSVSGDRFDIAYTGIPDDVCSEFRIRNLDRFESATACEVDSLGDETSKVTFTSI